MLLGRGDYADNLLAVLLYPLFGADAGVFFGVCSADVSRPSSRSRRPLVAGHIHVRPVGHTAREVAVAHLLLHTVW